MRTVKRSHNLQKWPTSGLIAYEIANRLCNSIEVFGFGIDPSFSNCSHYYNTDPADVRKCVYRYDSRLSNSMRFYDKYVKTGWHDMNKEWAFFKDKSSFTPRRRSFVDHSHRDSLRHPSVLGSLLA